ncbi:MAG: hypothetical protein LBM95_02435 [Lactobacillales bacterium]|nr:hypothetical protein [Lactobacillales bacterium]
MSEYFIQQRSLSTDARTLVQDTNGKTIFLMVGRWGTRGDVLSLYNMTGELVAQIKQSSVLFGHRFDLYENHVKIGSMQKLLNWHKDIYYVPKLHWLVSGDIANHRYKIQNLDETIMLMYPINTFSGQYYCLEIENPSYVPRSICIAAVLDYWLYRTNQEKNRRTNGIINFGAN